MPGEPSDFDVQDLWRNQATEHDPMTLAEIHEKAKTFQSKVSRRNLREYIACIVVIAVFTFILLNRASWMIQVGSGLCIAATIFVGWQLHRRASARSVPEPGQALVAAYREELIRQRDALRSVGAWYLAPFAPGIAFLMLGRWFQFRPPHRPIGLDHVIILLSAAIVVLVWLVVWLLNQRGADRLQRRIEEL